MALARKSVGTEKTPELEDNPALLIIVLSVGRIQERSETRPT
jgi:hypothetical protein